MVQNVKIKLQDKPFFKVLWCMWFCSGEMFLWHFCDFNSFVIFFAEKKMWKVE